MDSTGATPRISRRPRSRGDESKTPSSGADDETTSSHKGSTSHHHHELTGTIADDTTGDEGGGGLMETSSPSKEGKTSSRSNKKDEDGGVGGTPTTKNNKNANTNNNNKAVPCLPEERRKKMEKQLHTIKETVPGAKRMVDVINLLPPRVRNVFIFLTIAWKVIVAIFFLHAFFAAATMSASSFSSSDLESSPTQQQADVISNNIELVDTTTPRILYIVTTLAEYNNGLRKTEKGQDRLGEVLIPILVDSVESMVHEPFKYQVDVFIIAAYELKKEREETIRSRLPDGVGLEIWDDACPHGYEVKHSEDKVIDNTRALARQHRYVIKDKLDHYDFFVAFEDDMRITGDHVAHFLQMSKEIDDLRKEAPLTIPNQLPVNLDPKQMKYFGPMVKDQMDRLVPGFIRVEVLVNENVNGAQTQLDNIDLDYNFADWLSKDNDADHGGGKDAAKANYNNKDGAQQQPAKTSAAEIHFNPRICCHVQMKPNKNTPVHPYPKDVIIWETNVKALSALQMPKPRVGKLSNRLEWVGVLPGPGKRLDSRALVLGYWSGRNGAFGDEEKPSGGRPDIIAQQGGWMATRSQILRMNNDGLCQGSFLPPFDEPMYRKDGQESMNVEFWSGGYQFFTGVRGGCNMQRIISLHPDHFSNHFIYHVANNKQKQLNRERMLRADHFFAQLNTVRKAARKALIQDTA